jgi:hypothetical protein
MGLGSTDVPVPPPVTTATRPSTSKMFEGCRCDSGAGISTGLGSSKPVPPAEEGIVDDDMTGTSDINRKKLRGGRETGTF